MYILTTLRPLTPVLWHVPTCFDGWNVAHIYHERSALSGLIGVDVESDQRIG